MQNFKLLVGLGNPTAKYEKTRHNAGFWFLDQIAASYRLTFEQDARFQGAVTRLTLEGSSVFLLKPSTYMNHSGRSVGALARYYKIVPGEILVAHDELDFAPGIVRLKRGGGHGGHNGLRDLIAHLGSPDFFRLRFGIGHPGDRDVVVSYVLDPARVEERPLLQSAIERTVELLPELVNGSLDNATQRLHSR